MNSKLVGDKVMLIWGVVIFDFVLRGRQFPNCMNWWIHINQTCCGLMATGWPILTTSLQKISLPGCITKGGYFWNRLSVLYICIDRCMSHFCLLAYLDEFGWPVVASWACKSSCCGHGLLKKTYYLPVIIYRSIYIELPLSNGPVQLRV